MGGRCEVLELVAVGVGGISGVVLEVVPTDMTRHCF